MKRATEEAERKGQPPPSPEEVIAKATGDDSPEKAADPSVWGPPLPKPSAKPRASAKAAARPLVGAPAAAAKRKNPNPAVVAKTAAAGARENVAASGNAKRDKPAVGGMGRGVAGGGLKSRLAQQSASAAAKEKKKSPYAPSAVPGYNKNAPPGGAGTKAKTKTAAAKPRAPTKREQTTLSSRLTLPRQPTSSSPHAFPDDEVIEDDVVIEADELEEEEEEEEEEDDFPVHVVSTASATPGKPPVSAAAPEPYDPNRYVAAGDVTPHEERPASAAERRTDPEDALEVAQMLAGFAARAEEVRKSREDVAFIAGKDAGAGGSGSGKKKKKESPKPAPAERDGGEAESKKQKASPPEPAPAPPPAAAASVAEASASSAEPMRAGDENAKSQKKVKRNDPMTASWEKPSSADPDEPSIWYEAFLKLQERVVKDPAPKPMKTSVTKPLSDEKVVAEKIAAKKVVAIKAPKKPVAVAPPPTAPPAEPSAAVAPPQKSSNNPWNDAVIKPRVPKSSSSGNNGEEKAFRQMFDKRESRRMNAKPFAAAVQRWRLRRASRGGKASKPREEKAGGVKVYVRKRPLFAHEQERGEFDVVTVPDPPAPKTTVDATEIVVHNCQMHADLKRMFVKHASFDVSRAFGEAASSEEVYAVAAEPMVRGALAGGVGALFMYGQTGSGKTHTMEAIETAVVSALFNSGAVKNVTVAYFEIAGKKVTDLLSPARAEISIKEVGGGLVGAGAGRALEPEEYRQLDVLLLGAVEPKASTASELAAIVAAGKSRRATSATHCNAASSRSHAVLRLTCALRDGSAHTGRLTLVDCAGSERKEDNMHHSADQRKETAEINASLYALKECVRMRRLQHQRFGFNGAGGAKNAADAGHVHVPYRSSHLTRVLMECFVRPDAQLGVIGTVSPASVDTEHSVSTLKTVGMIGGMEEGDSWHDEMKEDVPRNLTMRDDGSVVETRVERVVAPVRWNNAHIRAWIARPGNEKLAAKVIVPKSLAGRDIVRMNPAALLKLCGGDHKLSQVMHNKLREEIARCSSKNLS